MALKKTINNVPSGYDTAAVLNDAYIKVDAVSGGKAMLDITVVAYNKKNGNMIPAIVKTHQFRPEVGIGASDFISQAYKHIKTLPEYANAEDC